MVQTNFAEPFFKYLSLRHSVSTKTLINNFKKKKSKFVKKAKPYFLVQLWNSDRIVVDLGIMTVGYRENSNIIDVNTSTWNYDDDNAYWAPDNKYYTFNLNKYGSSYFMVRNSNIKEFINLCMQYKELYTLEILMDNSAQISSIYP